MPTMALFQPRGNPDVKQALVIEGSV